MNKSKSGKPRHFSTYRGYRRNDRRRTREAQLALKRLARQQEQK